MGDFRTYGLKERWRCNKSAFHYVDGCGSDDRISGVIRLGSA